MKDKNQKYIKQQIADVKIATQNWQKNEFTNNYLSQAYAW